MMRLHAIFLLVLVLVTVCTSSEAVKKRRRAGGRLRKVRPTIAETSVYSESELNELDEHLNEIETTDELNQGNIHHKVYDPCKKRHCGAGQVCRLSEDGEPLCSCIPECPKETDPRRQVCSNKNETFTSDCELNQMRCWCKTGDPRCRDKELQHAHVEYYGGCKEMEECTEDQMKDFPRRMRDWLFHVMRDLADRQELSPYYQKMERMAENNYTRRWTTAAVWIWCDLDSGHDRTVNRHEIFPIKAPLMAMEHCISPFLNSCDPNGDHKITLQEWTHCLELDEEEIDEKCEELMDTNRSESEYFEEMKEE